LAGTAEGGSFPDARRFAHRLATNAARLLEERPRMKRLIGYLSNYIQFHLQAIADHFSAGILSPGIGPINPNVCKTQINKTTNTMMLSKLLIDAAIGM
jgi:20S proteasome alpha/beta subunit